MHKKIIYKSDFFYQLYYPALVWGHNHDMINTWPCLHINVYSVFSNLANPDERQCQVHW